MADSIGEISDSNMPQSPLQPIIVNMTAESALQRERGLLELNRLLTGRDTTPFHLFCINIQGSTAAMAVECNGIHLVCRQRQQWICERASVDRSTAVGYIRSLDSPLGSCQHGKGKAEPTHAVLFGSCSRLHQIARTSMTCRSHCHSLHKEI